MEYLENSMYKDKLGSAGLYYAQLVEREKALKALNSPRLGDSLLQADGTPWMNDLEKMSPKLNWDDLTQTAALPLGSWLKTDPWDDKVHQINAKRFAPMNARDKMPFEVTPIFYKLQRYDEAKVDSPATTAPATGGDQPVAQPQAVPPPQPQSQTSPTQQ
jgi:predicted component of type VI protein secretion system